MVTIKKGVRGIADGSTKQTYDPTQSGRITALSDLNGTKSSLH